MIWFAIIWFAVGSAAAILFGLMAHQSQVPTVRPDTHSDADESPPNDHIVAH